MCTRMHGASASLDLVSGFLRRARSTWRRKSDESRRTALGAPRPFLPRHGSMKYSNAFESEVVLGLAGSRDQYWQATSVPAICRSGSAPLAANAFMSIDSTPLHDPKLPPEACGGVRLSGVFTHSVPPWNGRAVGPWVP